LPQHTTRSGDEKSVVGSTDENEIEFLFLFVLGGVWSLLACEQMGAWRIDGHGKDGAGKIEEVAASAGNADDFFFRLARRTWQTKKRSDG
jgi:hypothetical protein